MDFGAVLEDLASLKRPSADFDLERDLPTTPEDVRAQRENRPRAGFNWLEQLQALSSAAAAPGCSPRPLAGFEPFEL